MRIVITRKLIAAVSIILIAITGFVIYWLFFTLHVSSTNPSLNSVSYQSPFLHISFNKPLKPSSLKIEGRGIVFTEKRQVKDETVTFYLNTVNLTVDKEVYFRLTAESKDGFKYSGEIRFTPKNISFTDLPADQQKVLKQLEGERPAYYTDPIMQHIPYSTLLYSLAPDFVTVPGGDTRLIINLTVYLSQVDLDNKEKVIKQRIAAAKKYISSKGLNPEQYSFNLNVIGG